MIKGVIFDLDGTVYIGRTAVPGAVDLIKRIRDEHIQILYVTNRANKTAAEIAAQLNQIGISAAPSEVLTSSQAAAEYLKPGDFYYIGQEGLKTPLEEAGFTYSEIAPDYVLVGLDPELTYDKLAKACRFIRNGSIFVATNMDPFAISEAGIAPGNGSIVEALRTATEIDPLVIGKPEKPIMDIALRRLKIDPDELIIVGDNIGTDIRAGKNSGIRSILILSGVSKVSDITDIVPDVVVDTFADLEKLVFPG